MGEARLSLSFCVLGSGSKGNCTLLALHHPRKPRYFLIDCGLSMRATAQRLAPLGIGIEHLSAILLTHLDGDHYQQNWIKRIRRHDIPVFLHLRHRTLALRSGLDGRHINLFREPFHLGEDTRIEPLMLAHDDIGSTGFIIEHRGARLGWATDLGRITPSLLERFVNLHALAIESNYDPGMQIASDRPLFLKRRIMGGAGHLANDQSLDAVIQIDRRSALTHVVTLHLSQQCNHPRIVERLYAQRAPHLLRQLTVAHQQRPTPVLDVPGDDHQAHPSGASTRRGDQLAMF